MQKGTVIISVAAFVIGLRLTMLWFIPVPVPALHDEFSYLLAADTFAHGRLTNPPHPMGVFFETFHVNMWPTYMSKYPPGQGAFLAFGQWLGHPWIGVLLSVAAMVAAGLWMLQGWFPPRWALLGVLLLLLRVGIFNYWMNSYFGGAVAALGGALALGALRRIIRDYRTRDSLVLGLGLAVLANSRPLEGIELALPVLAVLLVWSFTQRSPAWRLMFRRVVLPMTGAMLLCIIFMGYYNWRGTGSALLLPYAVNERSYSSIPTFFWQKPRPRVQYYNPQFETFYNAWTSRESLQARALGAGTAVSVLRALRKVIYFFAWPELCIPLFLFSCALFTRRGRLLTLLMGAFAIGAVLNPFSSPHYFAPFALVLFAMVVEGIRRLRACDYRGRRVGIAISRVLVLIAILGAALHPYPFGLSLSRTAVALLSPIDPQAREWQEPTEGALTREQIQRQLGSIPEGSLVIVRYSSDHNVHQEWVYNRADIDGAKVVWAREIPGLDIQPLLDYFRGRRVWLFEPDADRPLLSAYIQGRPCMR